MVTKQGPLNPTPRKKKNKSMEIGYMPLGAMQCVCTYTSIAHTRSRTHTHRDSVTFVTLPLDHADEIFPGTLKRANAARQELLWTLADADEVRISGFAD